VNKTIKSVVGDMLTGRVARNSMHDIVYCHYYYHYYYYLEDIYIYIYMYIYTHTLPCDESLY
jgi:hypothetical protein